MRNTKSPRLSHAAVAWLLVEAQGAAHTQCRTLPDRRVEQAARRAEDVVMGKRRFPLMSLLSDTIIEAELRDVTAYQHEWLPNIEVGTYLENPLIIPYP